MLRRPSRNGTGIPIHLKCVIHAYQQQASLVSLGHLSRTHEAFGGRLLLPWATFRCRLTQRNTKKERFQIIAERQPIKKEKKDGMSILIVSQSGDLRYWWTARIELNRISYLSLVCVFFVGRRFVTKEWRPAKESKSLFNLRQLWCLSWHSVATWLHRWETGQTLSKTCWAKKKKLEMSLNRNRPSGRNWAKYYPVLYTVELPSRWSKKCVSLDVVPHQGIEKRKTKTRQEERMKKKKDPSSRRTWRKTNIVLARVRKWMNSNVLAETCRRGGKKSIEARRAARFPCLTL